MNFRLCYSSGSEFKTIRKEVSMCGIAGAITISQIQNPPTSEIIYSMLIALQSRGQQGAKITVTKPNNDLVSIGGYGRVEQVLGGIDLKKDLPGNMSIGHVRYPTEGPAAKRNLQPLSRRGLWLGDIAIAHNGNLTNFQQLRDELRKNFVIFGSSTDTEVILHLLQRATAQEKYTPETRIECITEALREVCQKIRGSFSLLIMTATELIAITDPYNIRPLAMVRTADFFLLASETCAINAIEGKKYDLQHIGPGKIVIITKNGITHETQYAKKEFTRHCAFEHVYFSNPTSQSFGSSTFGIRKSIAKTFAKHTRTEKLDFICATPDSSNVFTMELARAAKISQQYALVKNEHVDRTFIEGNVEKRNKSINQKYMFNQDVISGARIGLVDDSLVRGSTSKKIVAKLREYGAKEVHLLIMSPPIIYPCDLGIDTPNIHELIAAKLTPEEIAKEVGADSIEYLTIEELREALSDTEQTRYCTTCFTGIPPSPEIGEDQILLRKRHAFSV